MKRIPSQTPLRRIRQRQGVFVVRSHSHPHEYRIGCAGCDHDRASLAERLRRLAGPAGSQPETYRLKPWVPIWIFAFDGVETGHDPRDLLKASLRDAGYRFGSPAYGRELIFTTADQPTRVRRAAQAAEREIRRLPRKRKGWWPFG